MRVQGFAVYHFSATLERPEFVLSSFEIGAWIWPQLRSIFPLALGACLMPDHPHVVAPVADPDAACQRFNRLFGHLARRLGVRRLGRMSAPKRIADRGKLQWELRYIGLNAPRGRLVDDPLVWLFSTHRDVVGAVFDPWIDAARLARALHRPSEGFAHWYHGYVSADPDVHTAGTPPPRPIRPTDVPTLPLAAVARAVAAAHRERPSFVRRPSVLRDQFVALALEQGWRNHDQLAAACDCSPRTIRRIATRIDPIALAPARLCLGDARLLAAAPAWEPTRARRIAS